MLDFSFQFPWFLAAGVAMAAGVAAVVVFRRPALPRLTMWLAGAGLLALAVAAGGPTWRRAEGREVVVMVDLSPSTRTAEFRQRPALEERINQLLGGKAHRIIFFAGENRADGPEFSGPGLADFPVDRTVFAPPAGAAAVLLFSDGQFAMPAAGPPVYSVIDRGLERVNDAGVERLEIRTTAEGKEIAATVRNGGAARGVEIEGGGKIRPATAPAGETVIIQPLPEDGAAGSTGVITARLSPGDAWPENDVLTIHAAPPEHRSQWWVGSGAPAGWETVAPSALPVDVAEYLGAGVIVLNDVPAEELSSQQQRKLTQYVRDLGGAVVILGGEHAFAAGHYTGSPLEALSPLASDPPRPAMHWLLLADSSGSMSKAIEGGSGETNWQMAAAAARGMLWRIPPADVVSIGDFAARVRWWSAGRRAGDTAGLPLPPAGISPTGETNLEAMLKQVAEEAPVPSGDGMPTQLLVISDLEATIEKPAEIAARLKEKNIRVHVLAIGGEGGAAGLDFIIAQTGGSVIHQADASRWGEAAGRLVGQAEEKRLSGEPIAVVFDGGQHFTAPPNRSASPWNRTWLKPDATELASGVAEGRRVPLAGRWRLGAGEVISIGFAANAAEAQALAGAVARPPRDPRLRVRWEAGESLRVRIDAAETSGAFLNGLRFTLELHDADSPTGGGRAEAIRQTEPGRYEVAVAGPRSPTIATVVQHQGGGAEGVVDRIAVAGRYAPEFDAIGNNHGAMHELADRTAGGVIDYRDTGRIEFNWPRRRVDLGAIFAILGGALLAAGLIRWRL